MKVLISGNSSGLGLGLTEVLLERGSEVWGFSRRGCPLNHEKLHDQRIDLSEMEQIAPGLGTLLGGAMELDLVVLNAGILGEIRMLNQTSLPEIYSIMDINVWANKLILDWLISSDVKVNQIILISSGAAVKGNKGWGAYALSKATLNMLTQLYAHEMPGSHLTAYAPGLVDTVMQDYIGDPEKVDENLYPSISRLRDAKGSDAMPGPREAGEQLLAVLDKLKNGYPSGSFVDIRNVN